MTLVQTIHKGGFSDQKIFASFESSIVFFWFFVTTLSFLVSMENKLFWGVFIIFWFALFFKFLVFNPRVKD